MKSVWVYRAIFLGCVALSVALVLITVSRRQTVAAPPAPSRVPASSDSTRAVPEDTSGATASLAPLASRVRIAGVIPFQREIYLHNFGDGAESLAGWQLASPRTGVSADDLFDLPVGTVLLPGETLIVIIDEGIDAMNVLYWRAQSDRPVLEQVGDTVSLIDNEGMERSRFTYRRS